MSSYPNTQSGMQSSSGPYGTLPPIDVGRIDSGAQDVEITSPVPVHGALKAADEFLRRDTGGNADLEMLKHPLNRVTSLDEQKSLMSAVAKQVAYASSHAEEAEKRSMNLLRQQEEDQVQREDEVKTAAVATAAKPVVSGSPAMHESGYETQNVKFRNKMQTKVQKWIDTIRSMHIPSQQISQSSAIAVLNLTKVGFLIGGVFGKGIIVPRREAGQGSGQSWGGPFMVSVSGANLGFLVGIESVKAVLLIKDVKVLQKLEQKSKSKIDANVTLVLGPVGKEGAVPSQKPEIIPFTSRKGLYLSLEMEAQVMKAAARQNIELHGPNATKKQMITGALPVPTVLKPLVHLLDQIDEHANQFNKIPQELRASRPQDEQAQAQAQAPPAAASSL